MIYIKLSKKMTNGYSSYSDQFFELNTWHIGSDFLHLQQQRESDQLSCYEIMLFSTPQRLRSEALPAQ